MNAAHLKAKWPLARHWAACGVAGLTLALWPSYGESKLWGESYNLGFLIPAGGFQVIRASARTPVETWQIVGKGPLLIAAVFWCCLFHFGTKVREWALKESSWRGAATNAVVTLSLALLVLGVMYWSLSMTQVWLLHSDNPRLVLRNFTLAMNWFPWLWMFAGVAAGLFVLWDGRNRPIAHKAFHLSLSLGVVIAVTIVAQPRLNQIMDLYGLVVDSAQRDLSRHALHQP
ncbi:MAG: hypothetical protein ABMA26_26690 [Limisphaerales bacterium]